MSILLPIFIALLSIILPGWFLALALLKKTKLSMLEIFAIGFTFGLIFPPTLTWAEAYLIPFFPATFSFSTNLYMTNVILLTVIGILLCFQQGAFSFSGMIDFIKGSPPSQPEIKKELDTLEVDYASRISNLRKRLAMLNLDTALVKKHEAAEAELRRRQEQDLMLLKNLTPEERENIVQQQKAEEAKILETHEREEEFLIKKAKENDGKQGFNLIWIILAVLMILTFATRMLSLGTAWKFFEFDPYFDMLSTEYILTHGYQLYYDHSAWPTVPQGTLHRIEPIVPYLEAYWYGLSNNYDHSYSYLNTTLLADVSSVYPPIVAALLVFVVFMFLYHGYGEIPAIIGAGFTAAMPALLTTFIAGEQLLEPWGIFTLFFFYATYLLAVNNMEEKRFAILAGIAFASTFLGAHYYTVDAGVLAIYIALQGAILVLRKENTMPFYTMNAVVIAVIAIFYALFAPYGGTLTAKTPNLLGVPIIVGFPLFALIFILILEHVPKLMKRNNLITTVDIRSYALWLGVLAAVAALAATFTSLGYPIRQYIYLSQHFTTPSIPLFMTVQEYAPTGFNFNFGPSGFGPIGASLFGVNLLVWGILLLFTALAIIAIYYQNSKTSILSLAAVWPLALAGMTEVKYLPHFGVGYIIAIGVIIGEAFIIIQNDYKLSGLKNVRLPDLDFSRLSILFIIGVSVIFVLFESLTFVAAFSAAANPDCNAIAQSGNPIGYDLYCNVVSNAWLNATTWMHTTIGPFGSRVLSWWDYGDWINWYGNTNAVLRGDNSVATLDYSTAAQFVLSQKDGYNATTLNRFMNSVQAKYVLFDNELMQKWQALDFLACIHANQTSLAFATQQGQQQGLPFVLGTSQCELQHSPVYAFVPLSQGNINNYCQINSTASSNPAFAKIILLVGSQFINQTYCVPVSIFNSAAPVHLYNANGIAINALIVPTTQFFYGAANITGAGRFADFLVLYTPNGPNNTITNAPTAFYSSNFYRGFFFGKLPGYTLAYPKNFSGMNYVNSSISSPIMILQLNNFTGTLPYVTPKPNYITNNYTMPG